jgi:WD40 repeat protein
MSLEDSTSPEEIDVSRLAALDDALAQGWDAAAVGSSDEVRRLLEAEMPFLQKLRQALTPLAPVQTLGRFQIHHELGRGSYGLVFLAYDPHLDRDVALKVPHANALVTPQLRERFVREARAAAALDHPNIVPVHEAGEIGPISYITYAYCPGPTLAAWLRARTEAVPARQAAALLATLAEAVAHAHGRGVVHRDLKPANVLLLQKKDEGGRMKDEKRRENGSDSSFLHPPLSFFIPKITDFGLARRTDDAGQTATGDVLGTPSYMAPEQAAGGGKAAGPAADVYALGAILYELLTGRPPFQTATALETLRLVREQEPVSPRRLNPAVPRDLETICLKCLEKESARRYDDASALAEDLRRFQEGKPVRARPVGPFERTRRWCRRNPGLAVASGIAATLLVATAVVSLAWAIDARERAKSLQVALEESQRQRAESYLDRGLVEAEHGDVALGLLWMARGLETTPSSEADLEWTNRANLSAWRGQHLALTSCSTPPGTVLGFGADGQSAWTVDQGTKKVQRWEWNNGQSVGPELEHPDLVTAFAASPDGRWVATGCLDKALRLWNAATGQVEQTLSDKGIPKALAFHPDGRTLLTARWVSEGGPAKTIYQTLDLTTAQCRTLPFDHLEKVSALAISPDGATLLTVTPFEKSVGRRDLSTGRFLTTMLRQQGDVHAVAFSPDGRTILTGGEDRTARLWEADSGRLLAVLHHRQSVQTVAFGADGQSLFTASPEDAVRVWKGRALPRPLQTHPLGGAVRVVEVGPDETRIVTGSDDRIIRIWKTSPEGLLLERELPHRTPLASAVFSPDGKLLATSTYQDNAAFLWDLDQGIQRAVLPHRAVLPPQRAVLMAVFSPDGKHLATASSDGTAGLWETATGQPALASVLRHDGPVTSVAFSPDGRTLLTGGEDHVARLWDAATGAFLRQLTGHRSIVYSVAFSLDGETILTGSFDGTARRWRTATGTPILPNLEHGNRVLKAGYSPDGSMILTGSLDHTARLWDAETGAFRKAPFQHAGPIWSATFSPDGHWVLTASEDATARLWDVRTGRALVGHPSSFGR